MLKIKLLSSLLFLDHQDSHMACDAKKCHHESPAC